MVDWLDGDILNGLADGTEVEMVVGVSNCIFNRLANGTNVKMVDRLAGGTLDRLRCTCGRYRSKNGSRTR